MRPLLLASSLAFALAAAAVADPDAAPETPPAAAPPLAAAASPAPETPKESPSSKAKPKPDAKAQADEMRRATDTYFKQCIEDWDAATHMTRKEWERTCRRVVQNRAKFMLDQLGK